MKAALALTILACILMACNQPVKGRNGVIYKSAVQYNDYIVGRQTTLMQNILDFGKMAETNLDSAEQMLHRFTNEAGTMITEIKGMPSYSGDSSLREAAVSSFSFYKKIFDNDYMQILNIRKKGTEVSNDDVTELSNIVTRISREEEGIDKAFHKAQKDFADKNNMKLMENKMQKKLNEKTGQ
jgi:hypothetical protein